jgi:hypothetical protein
MPEVPEVNPAVAGEFAQEPPLESAESTPTAETNMGTEELDPAVVDKVWGFMGVKRFGAVKAAFEQGQIIAGVHVGEGDEATVTPGLIDRNNFYITDLGLSDTQLELLSDQLLEGLMPYKTAFDAINDLRARCTEEQPEPTEDESARTSLVGMGRLGGTHMIGAGHVHQEPEQATNAEGEDDLSPDQKALILQGLERLEGTRFSVVSQNLADDVDLAEKAASLVSPLPPKPKPSMGTARSLDMNTYETVKAVVDATAALAVPTAATLVAMGTILGKVKAGQEAFRKWRSKSDAQPEKPANSGLWLPHTR